MQGLPCLWTQSKHGGMAQKSWEDLSLGSGRHLSGNCYITGWKTAWSRGMGEYLSASPLHDSSVGARGGEGAQQGRWGPAWSRAKVGK